MNTLCHRYLIFASYIIYVNALEGFLRYCRDHTVPVDFVPWHLYAPQPYDIVARAAIIQGLLDKYGFPNWESVLDEWNYFPGEWHSQEVDSQYRENLFQREMGGPPCAAFDACVLIYLQESTVALADFYQGTNLYWGGLFDIYGVPFKAFYTFKAFNVLLETPQRTVASGSDRNGFAVIAGISADKSKAAILAGNFGKQGSTQCQLSIRGLPWSGPSTVERYMVDERHNLDLTKSEKLAAGPLVLSEDVTAPSVCHDPSQSCTLNRNYSREPARGRYDTARQRGFFR